MNKSLAAGVLLVAQPELVEAAFMRSVIYLIEHHEGGSMGFILNRPLQMELDRVWESCPASLHGAMLCASGGPVEAQKGILLHCYGGLSDAYQVGPDLFIGGDEEALLTALNAWTPRQDPPLRLFLGHAGWSPGQLQAEVDQGTWLVADGHPALVLQNELDSDFWDTRIRLGGGLPRPSPN